MYTQVLFLNGLSHLKEMKSLEPLEENKNLLKEGVGWLTLGVIGLGAIGSKSQKWE